VSADAKALHGGRAVGAREVGCESEETVVVSGKRAIPSVKVKTVHSACAAVGMQILVSAEYFGFVSSRCCSGKKKRRTEQQNCKFAHIKTPYIENESIGPALAAKLEIRGNIVQ
jgi:hypothetical protein